MLPRHGGVEELHLLDGALWVDECKLYPADYHGLSQVQLRERRMERDGLHLGSYYFYERLA